MRLTKNIEDEELQRLIAAFQVKYGIPEKKVLSFIEKNKKLKLLESIEIPVSLFSETKLSSLEAITVYLRERKKLRFSEMDSLLNRNQIALSTSYRCAKKKEKETVFPKRSNYFIPCTIFANHSFSVLEHIVHYLQTKYHLSVKEISAILRKDISTIWTISYRVQTKERAQ